MQRGIKTEIAKRANISLAYLSVILSKKRVPPWRVAKRLAAATHTDPVLWVEGKIDELLPKLSRFTLETKKELHLAHDHPLYATNTSSGLKGAKTK